MRVASFCLDDSKSHVADLLYVEKGYRYNPLFSLGDDRVDEEEFMEFVKRQPEDPREDLRCAFKQFDKDGNGSIDKQELRGISNESHHTKPDLRRFS